MARPSTRRGELHRTRDEPRRMQLAGWELVFRQENQGRGQSKVREWFQRSGQRHPSRCFESVRRVAPTRHPLSVQSIVAARVDARRTRDALRFRQVRGWLHRQGLRMRGAYQLVSRSPTRERHLAFVDQVANYLEPPRRDRCGHAFCLAGRFHRHALWPVLNPCGVGLCCTMKLYQSITHTAPSGPTSARIGAVHSSSLASRFIGLVDV